MRFGISPGFRINLNVDNLINTFCLGPNEYLCASTSEIVRFTNQRIKQRYRHPCHCCVFARKINLLICSTDSHLSVFRADDVEHPLIDHFPTQQTKIRRLLCCEPEDSIIAIGETTKAWRIVLLASSVSITPHDPFTSGSPHSFTSVFTDILSNKYQILGNRLSGLDQNVIFSCNPKTNELLTSKRSSVLTLWNDILERVFEFSIRTTVESIQWISKRLALIIGTDNHINIFDSQLFKLFPCGILDKGTYFTSYGQHPCVFVLNHGILDVFHLVVPYRLWIKTDTTPLHIRRCDKERSAARIAVLCKDKPVQFFSPSTERELASCEIFGCTDFFYDRNLVVNIRADEETHRRDFEFLNLTDRDAALLPTANGLDIFSLAENSRRQVHSDGFTHISLCTNGTKWMYACSNNCGQITFLDRETYSEVSKQKLLNKRVRGMWCHYKSCSLLVGFDDEIVRFDLKQNEIADNIRVEPYEVARLSHDLLFVGCHSGFIQVIRVGEYGMTDLSDHHKVFHSDSVTGFSFARTFFVSSSRDKTLKFWNYNFEMIGEVEFPFQLLTCELLNGKRHVLAGIDRAILFIHAEFIFGQNVDIYDSFTDNFDMLSDPLDTVTETLHEETQDILVEDEEIMVPPIEIERVIEKPKKRKKTRKPLVSARRMTAKPFPLSEPEKKPENPRRKTAQVSSRKTPQPLISARVKPTGPAIKCPVKREAPLTDRPCVRAHVCNFNVDRLFQNDPVQVRFKWDDLPSARRVPIDANPRMKPRKFVK